MSCASLWIDHSCTVRSAYWQPSEALGRVRVRARARARARVRARVRVRVS